jgi:hypothetical protein
VLKEGSPFSFKFMDMAKWSAFNNQMNP